ncbi:2Fe-2S iron-sulfur cluster-binding protein [Ostreibacterium oceani]|uniref:FAD-dependent oxidoreductase n=1 Tax=Ostreibacterium oceani TaxID=2654998 RepID=A0A6N7EXN7_9GAMM|nr:2Fe-2S iron-sulfur cluster-binding protein [Ostreibacterium oceani]MPV86355.1 FAD-dependent oxidoreductase [Ostreibacterium oceani]
MSQQPFRLSEGGLINRDCPMTFYFDGKAYQGFAGDTLASALLANGVHLVGRSFKYHRPRGIVTAGSMEPNALVELNTGGNKAPNTRMTMVPISDQLTAKSQNAWPSLRFDVMAINRLLSPLLVAGFYYKTFMWPGLSGWMQYEKFIRRAAGLGKAADAPDTASYQHNHRFCDVLVVGSGISGLTAAIGYANAGKTVILADEHPVLGGRLNATTCAATATKRDELLDAVNANPAISVYTRTTVFGAYDHGVFGAVQIHYDDHGHHDNNGSDNNGSGNNGSDNTPQQAPKAPKTPREVYYKIQSDHVIYATGAIERPLLFKNNDLPGIMLAEALQTYLVQYAVMPAQAVVIATTNDSVYALAKAISRLTNVTVTVIDSRRAEDMGDVAADTKNHGITVIPNAKIQSAHGRHQVKSVTFIHDNKAQTLPCDLVAMSGGFTPNVNLQCHLGNKPHYDSEIDALVIDEHTEIHGKTIGSAAGIWALDDKIASANSAIKTPSTGNQLRQNNLHHDSRPQVLLCDEKAFVDFQHDVSNKDIAIANTEGYRSVEHTKRYTTLGMATDQGKLANFNALKLMSLYQGKPISEIGTTTYRPPYTPVTMGVLAGDKIGNKLKPHRRIPTFALQQAMGAHFTDVGLWQRPEFYPNSSTDTKAIAYKREAKATRDGVGIIDVSTLGKISVQGPDAAEFVNRLYINGMKKLPIGKIRYGLMLREDGIPFDDGTVMRISDNEFLITTTTAYAANVLQHMEHLLQIVWPELQVHVNTATDQWAVIAAAGPKSRAVLARIFTEVDFSNDALPFMGFVDTENNGIKVRIARISFSGELGYEVMIAANYAETLWQTLLAAGKDDNLTPYGTEAMGAMRIEKGFITHAEMDGRVNLYQLGMDGMMNRNKADFIGKFYAENRLSDCTGRHQLVGFRCKNNTDSFPPGYHLVAENHLNAQPSLGWITATTWSVGLSEFIALGYCIDGRDKLGQTLYAASPVDKKSVEVEVVSAQFFDPTGARSNG